MIRSTLCLAVLALPLIQDEAASPEQGAELAFPWLELPDGPAAKAWAAVGESTTPADFPADFPLASLASGDAWSSPDTWRVWSEWLVGEDGQDATTRRAGLTLLALEQGRNEDAWRHFGSCAQSPEWMARLMPCLLPGIPLEAQPLASGRAPELMDAVVLEPTIPSVPELESGVLAAREATVRDMVVNGTRFDMKVTFDSYGVQLDFEWKSGDGASLLVVIPEPDGFEIRVEYVDWMRQKEKRVPHLIELSERTPQMSLFARIRSTRARWPGLGEGPLPSELERAGLWLEHDPEEANLDLLEAVAAAATRVLGIPVQVREPASAPAGEADGRARGIVMRLAPAGPERRRQLAWLASSIEHSVLERSQAGK